MHSDLWQAWARMLPLNPPAPFPVTGNVNGEPPTSSSLYTKTKPSPSQSGTLSSWAWWFPTVPSFCSYGPRKNDGWGGAQQPILRCVPSPFNLKRLWSLEPGAPPLLPDPSPSYPFCWPLLCIPLSPPPSRDSCPSTAVLVLSISSLCLVSPHPIFPLLSPFSSIFQTLISLTNAVRISVRREGMVERAWGGPLGGGSPHPKAIYNSGCLRPTLLPLP